MRMIFVANPVAGGRHRERIRRAVGVLEEKSVDVELCWTQSAGHGRRLIAERAAAFDRLLVAGGDGTINEAINGLADGGIDRPLAILPAGTANVLAREIGLPSSLDDCAAIAATGNPRRICLGMANGQRFALMAGIGFDGRVVHRVRPGLKRWIGRGAYAASALLELFRGAGGPLEIEDETGRRLTGRWLVVANASRYGGPFKACPEASLTDDWLHVCLIDKKGRWALIRSAVDIAKGRGGRPPFARQLRVRRLRILTPGLEAQLDGDAWEEEPVLLESLPRALELVFP